MENLDWIYDAEVGRREWRCSDPVCRAKLGVVSIVEIHGTKHMHTAVRIKHQDHIVLVSDPVSLTTVSVLCRRCAALNEHTPVGNAAQYGLPSSVAV